MYEIMKVIIQSRHADTTEVIGKSNRNKTGVLTGGCTGEVQCGKSHLIFHLMRWLRITNIYLLVLQWRRQTWYVCAFTCRINSERLTDCGPLIQCGHYKDLYKTAVHTCGGVLTGGCTGEVQCSNSHSIFYFMRWLWIINNNLLVLQSRRQTWYIRMYFYMYNN